MVSLVDHARLNMWNLLDVVTKCVILKAKNLFCYIYGVTASSLLLFLFELCMYNIIEQELCTTCQYIVSSSGQCNELLQGQREIFCKCQSLCCSIYASLNNSPSLYLQEAQRLPNIIPTLRGDMSPLSFHANAGLPQEALLQYTL